jgi:molybdate transport system regulatory protein
MLNVRCKVWLERDGRPVFGDGRARLLEALEETPSLSAAARKLRIPYRTAWQHVNAMEKGYGRKIVERRVGGAAGGGCRLTEAGASLLHGYQAFRRGLDELLEKRLRRHLRLG